MICHVAFSGRDRGRSGELCCPLCRLSAGYSLSQSESEHLCPGRELRLSPWLAPSPPLLQPSSLALDRVYVPHVSVLLFVYTPPPPFPPPCARRRTPWVALIRLWCCRPAGRRTSESGHLYDGLGPTAIFEREKWGGSPFRCGMVGAARAGNPNRMSAHFIVWATYHPSPALILVSSEGPTELLPMGRPGRLTSPLL